VTLQLLEISSSPSLFLILKSITALEGENPFLKYKPSTIRNSPPNFKYDSPSIVTLPAVSAVKVMGFSLVPFPHWLTSLVYQKYIYLLDTQVFEKESAK